MATTRTPAAKRKLGFVALRHYAIGALISTIYILIVSRWRWNALPWGHLEFSEDGAKSLKLMGESTMYAFWQFSLLALIVLCSAVWVGFGSKVAVFRLRQVSHIWVLAAFLSIGYIWLLFHIHVIEPNLHLDLMTAGQKGFLGGFVVLVLGLGYGSHLAGKKGKGRLEGELLGLAAIVAILSAFIAQIWFRSPYFWPVFWIFIVPICLFFYRSLYMFLVEYIKDSRLFMIFGLGRGRETARFGGVNQFLRMDFTDYIRNNQNQIHWSNDSPIYYGKTRKQDDPTMLGRHIGDWTETHLLTVAGARSGKSRDAIHNNILSYPAGIICLDPKGEHTMRVRARRERSRPFYVIDPFNRVTDKDPTPPEPIIEEYNEIIRRKEIADIDIQSPHAFEQISEFANSIINYTQDKIRPELDEYMGGSTRREGLNHELKDIAVFVLEGLIAHFLTDPYCQEKFPLDYFETHVTHLMCSSVLHIEKRTKKDVERVARMKKNTAFDGIIIKMVNAVEGLTEAERNDVFNYVKVNGGYYQGAKTYPKTLTTTKQIPQPMEFSPTGNYSNRWNPLMEIDLERGSVRGQLMELAAASIPREANEGANSRHFRSNATRCLCGYMAQVLSDFNIPKEKKTLRTVYNLIVTGKIDGGAEDLKAKEKLLIDMLTNSAFEGAARDAAVLMEKVGKNESGSFYSTMTDGIEWMSDEKIQEITSGHDFNMADAKTGEASIFLVLPENELTKYSRFIRTFYTVALRKCNQSVTPQPKGSKRRVLLLFDEFSSLGYFEPIADVITKNAGSYNKVWMICQNIGQITNIYGNAADFLSSCDQQIFGLKHGDTETIQHVHRMLGKYSEQRGENAESFDLLTEHEIQKMLSPEGNYQIIFPSKGNPMILRRIQFWKNYAKSQYGDVHY